MSERPSETPLGIPTGFGASGRVGPHAVPPLARIRLTFSKEGALRFVGHLDLVRMWERAFRRAKLPLAYTLGFTPHPRLTFAAPLSLGATSEAELLDVYLREALTAEAVMDRIGAELPEGCAVRAAEALAVEGPPLTALTRWAAYTVLAAGAGDAEAGTAIEASRQGSRWSRGERSAATEANGEAPWRPTEERLASPEPEPPLPATAEVNARIERFVSARSVAHVRARDGKTVDVRPFVLSLELASGALTSDPPRVRLDMVVRLDASGAGRPDDVAGAIGLRARSIHRTKIGLDGEAPPT